jgi:hypothetical protein
VSAYHYICVLMLRLLQTLALWLRYMRLSCCAYGVQFQTITGVTDPKNMLLGDARTLYERTGMLLYCCFTAALLLLYCCFTAASVTCARCMNAQALQRIRLSMRAGRMPGMLLQVQPLLKSVCLIRP